jgi:hypothetical protein
MTQSERGYFQLEQAREVNEIFAKHGVEFLFIGKGGAIILGYPSATQDVDIFPKKSVENSKRLISALRELDFEIDDPLADKIIAGADFVQLSQGPFDLDLVFAPDGIENFDTARARMIVVDGFPVAHIRDIIASKRAAGREKDMSDIPLLEDFREELERELRGPLKSALDIAMDRTRRNDSK